MISAHFTDEKAKALKLSNLLTITELLSGGAEIRCNSRSLNPNTEVSNHSWLSSDHGLSFDGPLYGVDAIKRSSNHSQRVGESLSPGQQKTFPKLVPEGACCPPQSKILLNFLLLEIIINCS